ncbi:caspase family protein [Altericista sp. CCNU0014]|uniref:caspase family protein n=1 Tax=Altericista sp. CCNU0014 TaxID=3082949 RepID=UPI00384C98F5
MTTEIDQIPNLYALLIGIDCYMPNQLPDGSYYKNLGGCVRDINHVEAFLKDYQKIPENQILKLTASPSAEDEKKPLESADKLPTRSNMITAFRKLGEIAPVKSQIYIHYSGHGGRAKTVFTEIKGEEGIDEGLVPTDIGNTEGQYLRDLDLAQLLKELVAKDLTVTAILDCCHSGGATRGDVEIRGMNVIDDKPLLPGQENIVPLESLQTFIGVGTRGLKEGGLPSSEDCVVVAACRQNEYAYEYAFNRETRERNGALTYWLLDTLKQKNAGQSYQDLFDRINAKIHTQFSQQTPMLMGPGNRKIFGSELTEEINAVSVLNIETNAETQEVQALLAVGQVNGISKGAEFAIYSRDTDLKQKENRIAIARIIQRGATESLCKLEPIEGKEFKVEQGDRAVLVSPSVNLVRKVVLFEKKEATSEEVAKPPLPDDKLSPEIFKQQKAALEAIKNALPGNGWVELAEDVVDIDDDEGVAYQVALNDKGEYEICDRTGHAYSNIVPVMLSESDAAAKVVKRLVHLAKFHTAAEIDNTDSDSPLAGKLSVEWLGTSDIYEQGDKIPPKSQMKPFTDPSQPTVKLGEYIFLSIQNNSLQALNVAALDLASDWSIEKIFPGKSADFVTIEAGKKDVVALPTTSAGMDTVKVFASVGAANFRWLELPALDREQTTRSLRSPQNALEALLSAIDGEKPKTRKLSIAASPSREWTTKQIDLTVVK